MKKLKYILLALVVGGTLSSCYDDDPINEFPVQGLTNVTLGVATPNSVTAEAFGLPITATIPQAFDQDVTVQAQLDFLGGVANSNVTIPAGSTSAAGSIAMPSNPEAKFTGQDVILSLSGLSLPDQSAAFDVTSNEVMLKSFDRVQWPYGAATIDGRMTVLFDWANPGSNDLDMRIFNTETLEQVESALTGSRWETDIFNDTHPDGDYFVLIQIFRGAEVSGDIPWEIFFVDPDQTTVTNFNGTFADPANDSEISTLVNFTKSTDADDNVSYTYSLPTATKSFTQVQIAKIKSQLSKK